MCLAVLGVLISQGLSLAQQPVVTTTTTTTTQTMPNGTIVQTTFAFEHDPNAPSNLVPQAPEEPEPSFSPSWNPLEAHKCDNCVVTWVPTNGLSSFGIVDLEWGDRLTNPWIDSMWLRSDQIIYANGGFGIHWWEGPLGNAPNKVPDLPPQVFDLYLDLIWHWRLTDWLTAHVDATPGLYTDFGVTPPQAFRWRGKAVGIVNLTDSLQISAGVDYVNRLTVRTIPAGGVIWEPLDGTRLELVVPYPRIMQRFLSRNGHEWWGYLAGEWGGGAWTFKNAAAGHEDVEYDDYRIIAGLEWQSRWDTTAHFEAGYVFHRRLHFVGAEPDFHPTDGFMLRVGLVR